VRGKEIMERTEADIMAELFALVRELGWGIAIPNQEGETVDHLVIGDPEALVEVDEVMGEYQIFEATDDEEYDGSLN
jgi:hypothetical protein